MSTDGIELFTGDEILDQLVRREGPDGAVRRSTLGRGIRCPASRDTGAAGPLSPPSQAALTWCGGYLYRLALL